MDEIQKVLVKAGRKDLAQKYYLKVVGTKQKNARGGPGEDMLVEKFPREEEKVREFIGEHFNDMYTALNDRPNLIVNQFKRFLKGRAVQEL